MKRLSKYLSALLIISVIMAFSLTQGFAGTMDSIFSQAASKAGVAVQTPQLSDKPAQKTIVPNNPSVSWRYDKKTQTLFLEGNGEIDNYELNGARPEWDIYNDIAKEIDIGEGITRVGDYAFWGFDKAEKLILPGTCKEIGLEAFSHNDNLTYIYFSEGLETIGDGSFFWNRTRFHTELPNSLKTIERDAFYFNEKFSTIVIPEHVERIGDTALNAANAIYFVTEEPPEMPYEISLAQKGTVYVPFGSREKYEQVISVMKSSNPYNPTVNMKNKAAWKVEEYDPEVISLIDKLEYKTRTQITTSPSGKRCIMVYTEGLDVSRIESAGYTVKYDFYTSTNAKTWTKSKVTDKSEPVYYNTAAKPGNRYYYKIVCKAFDADGNEICSSDLTKTKYGYRTWK